MGSPGYVPIEGGEPRRRSAGGDLGELLGDAQLAWAGECARWRRCAPEEVALAAGVPDLAGVAAAAPGLDPAALARALAPAPAALLLGVEPESLPAELATNAYRAAQAPGPFPAEASRGASAQCLPTREGGGKIPSPLPAPGPTPHGAGASPARPADPLGESSDDDLDALLGGAPSAVGGSRGGMGVGRLADGPPPPAVRGVVGGGGGGSGSSDDDDADLDALLNS